MADTPALIDIHGRPLRPAASPAQLAEIVARPTTAGVRQAWNATTVASGLTPERLAGMMRRAAEGDAHDYLTLAEEMEERDWHYACELGKRKLAVLALDRVVKPASDDPKDVEIAQAVKEEIVQDEAFEDLMAGSLASLGKGYAAVEMEWRTGKRWAPTAYAWRDPRWFMWDRLTGRELRMLDAADMANGVELPAYKFAIHQPQLKMGLPIRGGLARLAAWAFLFKFYDVKDWAPFPESFGQPLRLGKYDARATPQDVDILYRAVAMIGTDCAAVIPKSMDIEFVKSETTSSTDLYQRFADFLDKQVSKAVLGQAGTADMQSGGGYAQSKVLDGVRGDLTEADAKQMARTVRRDVFEPFVRFNYGPQYKTPLFVLETPESEDLKNLADALTPFIDRGLKVRASDVLGKFGLSTPEGDDEVLGAAAPAAIPPAPVALNRRTFGGGAPGGPGGAGGGRGPGVGARGPIAALADEALGGWVEQLDPMIEPFERLAATAGSYEEFEAGLVGGAAQMDATALARSLGAAFFKARAHGDVHDDPTA